MNATSTRTTGTQAGTTQDTTPALAWFTSSHSSGNGQCVEAARLPEGGMAIRDTKNRQGTILRFTPDAWQAFTAGMREG